jgi:hypothetical protein
MFDLHAALRGDLENWRGLPAGISLRDVLDALAPVTAVAAAEERPRGETSKDVVEVTCGGAAPPVEVWCKRGSERVSSIEFDLDASAASAEPSLGPPELRLDDRRFHPEGVVSECVWPVRGLTLSVLRPFDGSASRIVHVQLYASMPAALYLTDVAAAEHPMPRTDGRP